jgi:hypothetical protein
LRRRRLQRWDWNTASDERQDDHNYGKVHPIGSHGISPFSLKGISTREPALSVFVGMPRFHGTTECASSPNPERHAHISTEQRSSQ